MTKAKKYYAPTLKSLWLPSIVAVDLFVSTGYRMGFALFAVQKTRKYLFFGEARFKVTMVSTMDALKAKKHEILTQSEDYEMAECVDACIKRTETMELID